MIQLNKLSIICHNIAVMRGQINSCTSPRAIVMHISREWRELCTATKFRSEHLPQYSEQEEEAADVIITCMVYLHSIGCNDIEKLIRDKIKFNESRVD